VALEASVPVQRPFGEADGGAEEEGCGEAGEGEVS